MAVEVCSVVAIDYDDEDDERGEAGEENRSREDVSRRKDHCELTEHDKSWLARNERDLPLLLGE